MYPIPFIALGGRKPFRACFFLIWNNYLHYFSFCSGDDEDSANQKRKRILQSQRPVDSDGNGFGSDELFSKYALCYKFENLQI